MATANYCFEKAKSDLKSACKYIEAGVAVEEKNGKPSDAIKNYKNGICMLDRSLEVTTIKNAKSVDMIELRSKMVKYRKMGAERVAILSSTMSLKKQPVPIQHIRPVVTPTIAASKPKTTNRPISGQARNMCDAKSTAHEKLQKYDKTIVTKVLDDVLTDCSTISFEDIAGNDDTKEQLRETVIYPTLRPELFTGLRAPVRGILLFGPPGNGKTMLAKAVANESKCVFLNISAASILSKWVGDSERYVKVLFAVARALEPAIIFLDEIDALLMARKEETSGNNVARRVLTQFLCELDGVGSGSERVLVLGATNRPQELDDAALRRFPKRLIVPMPNVTGRICLLTNLLSNQPTISLSKADIKKVAQLTNGYTGSDLTQLAKDAALGPIRDLKPGQLANIPEHAVRSIYVRDFEESLQRIRPSLTPDSLQTFYDWNEKFGDSKTATNSNSSGTKMPSYFTSLFS